MSTETNTNPNGSANAAPAQQPAAAPAAPPIVAKPKYEIDYDPNNPPWLNERLERERKTAAKEAEASVRKAMLAELGFDDPEVAKKLAADAKKRAEDQKTLEQRVAERDATLKAKEDRNRELEESVKSYADMQLASLTEQQKAAVLAVAGTDPPRQLKMIEALRPTWIVAAPAAPAAPAAVSVDATKGSGSTNQTQQPAAAPPKPAGATAPGATAPPPSGSVVVANHLETYNAMNDPKSPNYAPFSAAQYYARYQNEIVAAQKSRSATN